MQKALQSAFNPLYSFPDGTNIISIVTSIHILYNSELLSKMVSVSLRYAHLSKKVKKLEF